MTRSLLGIGLLLLLLCPECCLAQKDPRTPLRIRISKSLLTGTAEEEANAACKTVVDYLSRKVTWPIEFELQSISAARDLDSLTKKLTSGECPVAVVCSLEYGWLLQREREMRPLALFFSGDREAAQRFQLYVRTSDVGTPLSGLRGKVLADYKEISYLDRLSLDQILLAAQADPATFFRTGKPHATVRDAVAAVLERKADAVALSTATYQRLLQAIPDLKTTLGTVGPAEASPLPAVVGIPSHVEKLRPDLWEMLRERLYEFHKTPDGREVTRLWRFQSFTAPDDQFQQRVETLMRRYPLGAATIPSPAPRP